MTETIVDIRGPIRLRKFKISDYHNYGKELSVSDIIVKSSNIGTARIATMIGSTAQQNFLGSLGFLEPIPLEMVEASGGKPLVQENWSDLSTMTISYGHGLSATPLHLAVECCHCQRRVRDPDALADETSRAPSCSVR